MVSLILFFLFISGVTGLGKGLYYHVAPPAECVHQASLGSFTDISSPYCGRLCVQFPFCTRFLHCPNPRVCSIGGTDASIFSLLSPECVCYTALPNCQNGGRLTSRGTCDCPPGFRGTECRNRIRDCTDLKDSGSSERHVTSLIYPENAPEPFLVYCDVQYGLTYLLSRQDSACAKTSFDRPWQEYIDGFGDFDCDFWLGLDKIHFVTTQAQYKLNVLIDDGLSYSQCFYNPFSVDGAASNYTATIPDTYSTLECDGLLGSDDGFGINGLPFSTHDHDSSSTGCPVTMSSGWWFGDLCLVGNPNGPYISEQDYLVNPGTTRLRLGGGFSNKWIKALHVRVERVSG